MTKHSKQKHTRPARNFKWIYWYAPAATTSVGKCEKHRGLQCLQTCFGSGYFSIVTEGRRFAELTHQKGRFRSLGNSLFRQLTWLRASIANFDFNGPAGFPAEIEFWLVTNTRQAKPGRGSFDWFALFVSDVRMRLHLCLFFFGFLVANLFAAKLCKLGGNWYTFFLTCIIFKLFHFCVVNCLKLVAENVNFAAEFSPWEVNWINLLLIAHA